jgi:hypothetical protein
MPFPRLETGRVDKQVSSVLLAYTNKQYLAPEILPALTVKEESGLIGTIANEHLRIFDSRRSVYDEGQHRMEFKYSNDKSYRIEYYDLSAYVPDRIQNQVQSPFEARRDASFSTAQAMMLERENALAAAMTSTAVLTQNVTLAGTDKFSDYLNSTPEDVFEDARSTIQTAIGREANAILMSRGVFNTLKRHPFFLEMVKGIRSISGSVLKELIKDFFEVEYVFVSSNVKITSNEGQTETKSAVWGNDVVFFYRPPTPSLFEPSLGYQFTIGENMRAVVRRHGEDKGDIVENQWAYQDKILMTDAAYLIKDAI